ncbi:MAG: VOC family protein [Litoreibacter sp.]|nr:VOC family protein [Litoreibacter sp.]MCY4334769.1 VOC family protein [Litoreibacter sp.]
MLQAVSVGTNDLKASTAFYDALLGVLGIERLLQNETEVGYGTSETGALFFVNLPFDRESATIGNGVQISFAAKDRQTVDRFHKCALELGAADEGAPGFRSYSPGYYGAYCRDLDGNKLHVAFVPDK